MELETLRIFCAVAQEQSVTRAALGLKRVQSNVTTRIQHLEAELGVELFVRSGKRMLLSTAGQHLLGYAQQLLVLADVTLQAVSEGRYGGVLRIGGMECTAASRISSILAVYSARHFSTRTEFRCGTSRQLLEQLRIGQLDCAFLALPPALQSIEKLGGFGLRAQLMWQEDLMLLLHESEAQVVTASDVRARALAVFALGCAYRDFAQQWLGTIGTTDWRTVEVGSYHQMTMCVITGECVAFLPRSVLNALRELPATKALQVGQVDTWLVWRQGGETPALQHLLLQLLGDCEGTAVHYSESEKS